MNLALFDFDGTITFGDTFTPFLHFAVEPRRLTLGKLVLAPVIAAYKLGFIPASTGRASAAAVGFRGRSEAGLREAGAKYARDVLPNVIRPEALERIHWHKEQGDVVVVVSASLDVYLEPWCFEHQLDVICTQLEVTSGTLTGKYCEGDCTGKEKSRRILTEYDLRDYPLVYSYGDTAEDQEMLNLATKKYFQWREID
jgi:phosphatidylglycerophosphatase C